MRKLSNLCLLLLIATFASYQLCAQQSDYSYHKEKVYLQTNHVFFKPGETLFFKIYLVNGDDQRPSSVSNVVFVDVLAPSGNLVEKQTYQVRDGYSEGSFQIKDQSAGGLYKLKAYTSWMQNEKDSTFFQKEFTVQKTIAPRILMKLDFPKKGYGAGDEVLADFSMRSLNDQPIRSHPATFKVSIGGQVIETSKLETDGAGKAKVKFNLPTNLQTTDGLLNITVNYDSYTESISRSIPITLNKIDLQFMPEGGSFISGINTQVAFRAVNEFGKPVDVKGVVTDVKGNNIASFESYQFGMGKFPFTPKAGEVYQVKITSPAGIKETYSLPVVAFTGVVMNVDETGGKVKVILSATDDRFVKLVGQTKGVTYYSHEISIRKGINNIPIDDNLFPAGIARFTLYDEAKLPMAERIVFLNEHKKLHVEISTNKTKYLPREKVTMTIVAKDEHGKPIPANFSMAVVDDKLWSFADDKQDHILSWLLMSSELSGKIEEPQFYFKKDEPKAAAALDLVMLTHGYRYFDFIEYVKQHTELKYTPTQNNIVSGIITNAKGQPVKASVFLVNNTTGGKAINVVTNPDGTFYFSNLTGRANYILIAKSLQKRETTNIRITQNGMGYNPLAGVPSKQLLVIDKFAAVVQKPKDDIAKQAAAERKPIAFKDELFPGGNAQLNEVVVTGFGARSKKDMVGSVTTVKAEELQAIPANALLDVVQGRVAGIVVTPAGNPGATPKVQIRGNASITSGNEPLFVVNGVPVEGSAFANLNVNDIEVVEVLKDAMATSLYGFRAANGVILVQTKKAGNEKLKIDLSGKHYYATQSFVAKEGNPYTVARRFYAPKYNSTITTERNDFRETVYWNPVVQTNKEGKATVEFYNSDATTTFRTIVEGIGYNGKLGREEATYAVQAAMSVDAKIPPYLTVGDKAKIPLVIKNNSTGNMKINIEVSLPEHMHVGPFDPSVMLAPGNSTKLFIPIEASATSGGNIRFTMKSELGMEIISLPVSATNKGFPVITSISGNKNAVQNLTINKMVPGSLQPKLTLYKSVEGQLVDGIESMLREPHGCFEQTSSSTYPNIYVLKYLRQSGRSNPAIEKKAMDYLEQGYKRLVGFETSEHGFEWFGHAPAHEALTAYGLLEFTDMKEFLSVDKSMLERTKKFLLNRRDGNGGFKLASGGYDRFASVPNKIANIYIVYAMTQAGFGKDIVPEYNAAVKKALESNDAYQMAMMALAASNVKNQNDYRLLMQALNTNYQQKKFTSETSVVNSRDESLQVEAMSLYALALMRNTTPDIGTTAELVSGIMNKKSYYGYGSTQATVLALNAVVEYSKLAGQQAQSEILFTLNDKPLGSETKLDASLIEGSNSFAVKYAGKGEGIPYNLEVAYHTFTPPNSDKAELKLATHIATNKPKTGETVRMNIEVRNEKSTLQPMAIAKIGIPAGLLLQPWQLKELTEKKEVAYYEIFDNYLVLYWMGFGANETKKINLDLKAEVPGTYRAKASNVYLYYTPEYKNWNEGIEVEVQE